MNVDTNEDSQSRRMCRPKTGLLAVDFQERLLPAIEGRESVLARAEQMLLAARELKIDVVLTEQYRKGLGPTVPSIRAAAGDVQPVEKMTFSAAWVDTVLASLSGSGVQDVLLCGIEGHVCVCQTALDLLDGGRRVFVLADAVSSRTLANRDIGLDRMKQAGASIVSVEMAIFELLGQAGTDEFKRVLPLVK